jgi:hypothetical protein
MAPKRWHGCRGFVAEALHRVVRATRFGCNSDTTPDVSREAFTMPHKQFPRSEWAKADALLVPLTASARC